MRGGRGRRVRGRNELAIRLMRLLRLLAGRDRLPNPADLARELSVDPKTIRRDLDALEAARVILPQGVGYNGVPFVLALELRRQP